MHIRPRNEASSHITSRLPPLPPNKTVVQVFADFLTYLFKCASSYIIETHANGEDLWNSVKNDIEYVISHPNGWEGFQQQQIRQAVVLAGFVKDDEAGRARVRFVTEGEASLHFSIRNGLPEGAMKVSFPCPNKCARFLIFLTGRRRSGYRRCGRRDNRLEHL